MKNKSIQLATSIIIVIAFLTPIALYALNFGISVSGNHQKWSEFGSFFSGIYSPILATLTLLLLISQRIYQVETDTYHMEHAMIQRNTESVNFLIGKLERVLNLHVDDTKVIINLYNRLKDVNEDTIDSRANRDLLKELYIEFEPLATLWDSIYSNFALVKDSESEILRSHYKATKLKLLGVFSHNVCVCLDKLVCAQYMDTNSRREFWHD